MAKKDPFTQALKADFKARKISGPEAARLAKKSFDQYKKELYGKTKQGMMSIETVAELAKEGAISNDTIEAWWITKRQALRMKKRHQGNKKAATVGTGYRQGI